MVFGMFVTVVAMLVALAVAGCVMAYVAYVSQGREVPRARWLTGLIAGVVDRFVGASGSAPRGDRGPRGDRRRGGTGHASRR